MNTTTTDRQALHSIRDAQLKALVAINPFELSLPDAVRVGAVALLCGRRYDTRNLSDKALEEIDSLAGKYLERVK